MKLTPDQLLEECKDLAFTVHILTKYVKQLEFENADLKIEVNEMRNS